MKNRISPRRTRMPGPWFQGCATHRRKRLGCDHARGEQPSGQSRTQLGNQVREAGPLVDNLEGLVRRSGLRTYRYSERNTGSRPN
jgi:hypothetical protein